MFSTRLNKFNALVSLAISIILFLSSLPVVLGQTRLKPGMNFFSIQQDIELGRHAAQEIEQQMPMVKDSDVQAYISDLGKKLARNTALPDLPWQFKVVNLSDVNAFALPGGFIYVHRGLMESSETEGQLVSVLCHEISHVTLRHSTNQMSRAVVAQIPLSVLGGLTGGKGLIGQLSQLGLGVGANLAFMKFSRTAETQADIAGSQLMVKSGYDPHEMTRMFENLEHLRRREPGRLEQWFSSHPTPENRIQRIDQEIALMRPASNLSKDSSRFHSAQSRLRSMPAAPKSRPQRRAAENSGQQGRPERPSKNFQTYTHSQNLFRISFPANWRVGESGNGAVFVPEGGVMRADDRSDIVYGALVNFFEPHARFNSRRNISLAEATDELIDHLMHGNPYLSRVSDLKKESLSGAEAASVTLSGNRGGGENEIVWLLDRWYGNDVLFYVLFIAPEQEFNFYQNTFKEMARSTRIPE